MAAKDSDYAAALLDESYGDIDYIPPSDYWVALYTDVPTAASIGTEVDGTIYSNYARVQIPNDATNWGPAVITSNVAAIWNLLDVVFPTAVIASGVEVIRGVAIWDDATAGNRKHFGALVGTISIINGITPKFVAGTLIIKEI